MLEESVSSPSPPTCDVCGRDEKTERRVLNMVDTYRGRSVWWHNGCVPGGVRAALIACGWEFPPLSNDKYEQPIDGITVDGKQIEPPKLGQ